MNERRRKRVLRPLLPLTKRLRLGLTGKQRQHPKPESPGANVEEEVVEGGEGEEEA